MFLLNQIKKAVLILKNPLSKFNSVYIMIIKCVLLISRPNAIIYQIN